MVRLVVESLSSRQSKKTLRWIPFFQRRAPSREHYKHGTLGFVSSVRVFAHVGASYSIIARTITPNCRLISQRGAFSTRASQPAEFPLPKHNSRLRGFCAQEFPMSLIRN
jgi:hypothetical protein